MLKYHNLIIKLIDRYHYGSALEILEDIKLENTDVYKIIESCMYAVNFDFKTAHSVLEEIEDEKKQALEVRELIINLENLIKGEPDAIYSELIDNIKFEISSKEFIDCLGRVYRFKEAIFKYIFITEHINRKRFSFLLDVMSKRMILKILRKKYKIFNSNLIYGITTYINRHHKKNPKYMEIVNILNSEKMTNLIELRNDSIVGHGFSGVSREDIVKAYGNPYNVIDDFIRCLELLDLKITDNKYFKINSFIKKELLKINS